MGGRMTGIRGVLAIIGLLLFVISSAGAAAFSDLYNFKPGSVDGQHPFGSLAQSGSVLYGMTNSGGNGDGTIFSYNLNNGIEDVDYDFGSYSGDGGSPYGSLITSGSLLYGMTPGGGSFGGGGVFAFDVTNGEESVIYSFGANANDGGGPFGSLIESGQDLYGMTRDGGSNGQGTIFSIDAQNDAETILYSFVASAYDGNGPMGSLVQSGPILYGLTPAGGAGRNGTIISFDTSDNEESLLYSFGQTPTDGASPRGSLLQSGAMLYGTTAGGGANGDGAVFEFDTLTGVESVLYSFGSVTNDGTDPRCSLILVGDTLYGTTENGGGSLGDGTIFGFDLDNDSYSMLHAFDGTDGANPTGDLLDVDNTLYGLASNGGTHGAGVVFSVTVPEPSSAALLAATALLLLARRLQRVL